MGEKPYLAAAFFCEKILYEKDDVLSAVRLVDTFFVTLPPNLPEEATPVIQLTALIGFKQAAPSDKPEKHQLQILMHAPSGPKSLQAAPDILFKPNEQAAGANIVLHIATNAKEFGLYWTDVLLDGELVTRIPFKLLAAPICPPETIH